jgi:predicted adenine nucleotide alpha hydrolase (AANH) superfamily ATPase
MKLLLHICCAPCLIYPLERLRQNDFEVTGFFYNPNIHPFPEYKNRRQAVKDYAKKLSIEIIYPEYLPQELFRTVNMRENKPERCPLCWSLRLKKTAQVAIEKGCNYFSTTLLVSPYQDQELLKKVGNELAKETGISFYYEDFRPGFRKAHIKAKQEGIYCQKYCGCIYSEIERYGKSQITNSKPQTNQNTLP